MRLPAAERREQLLTIALDVFAGKGFHKTSMNDVAEAAGVTKPVLYQHFTSKRGLYLELLAEIGAELRDTIAKATAEASGPREQINLAFVAYFTFVAENSNAFRVLFGDSTRRDEEFADEARRVEASIAELTAELINVEGLSWERRLLLGNGIVGLAEGSCHYWLANSLDVDAETLAAQVSQLAWAGLRGHRLTMAGDVLTFDCPRCSTAVSEAYYGPCTSCRGELRAQYADLAQGDVVAEEYAPKMNVTPNAVALKDD